ncbi:MAG: hypothetical protein IKT43_01165 [Clostridia bacterium]|nr:hypothetical protein [Clostridia bacterium]
MRRRDATSLKYQYFSCETLLLRKLKDVDMRMQENRAIMLYSPLLEKVEKE